MADGIASSSSTVYCHTKPRKKPGQHYESMLREHRLTREYEACSGISHRRRRLNLLEHADGVRDGPAAEEARQLHSGSHGGGAGSAPAAQRERDRPCGARAGRPFSMARGASKSSEGGAVTESTNKIPQITVTSITLSRTG